ncbi:UDP-glucose/GDP-mannose dehydrogenase family protein [Candidatus Peregrinibacteria bacterium]|nr:UDP-glucose/GDP-mannose dehydrogenase family protein [Candidatus Peregrinibacteria bacterium]
MNIAIIGAGYVGLTSAAVFAKLGHKVWVLDTAQEKIRLLKHGKVHFYEPQLPELIRGAVKKKQLVPTESYAVALKSADVIFVCVGTPPLETGESDLSQVFHAAEQIAKYLKKDCVVVMKSTVPVGTTEKIKEIIKKKTAVSFDVASSPEFLREGSAVSNTLYPDRIVIGVESNHTAKILTAKILLKLHEKLLGERVITDLRTAEIIKYASNAFLATKISFINEIANLCDSVGANVDDVALGMGLDPRIGKAFLKAGIGYGGSCFPKDTKALHRVAISNAYNFKLLKAVIEVNQTQRRLFLGKVRRELGTLEKKNIGVLGLAFKNNTDDVRESAAMDIIQWLINEGANVKAYDPKAMQNAKKIIHKLKICKKPEEVALKADALLILTEWEEFKNLPWPLIKKKMRDAIIFDGRNLINPQSIRKYGFKYMSIGRP